MKSPFVRSVHNYDVTAASDDTAIGPGGPSLTVQSQTEDSDLNVLMKRFGVTGKMPENVRFPSYGDFTHVSDYRSAIEAANLAEESFLQFPAEIRAQFENNPQLFLQFVENPANIEQTKKWFPKENFDAGSSTVRGNASQSSPPNASGGAGAPPSDGGAATAQRPNEQGRSP